MRAISEYRELFSTCRPAGAEWVAQAYKVANVDALGSAHMPDPGAYHRVEENTGVPWIVTAALHYREADMWRTRQILNGERWWNTTQLTPKGLGPWTTFQESCEFYYRSIGWYGLDPSEWTVPPLLRRLEVHNGWGFYNRGLQSSYLWNGTNHAPDTSPGDGVAHGGYAEDGRFSATYLSDQVGCALIVQQAIEIGTWRPFVDAGPGVKFDMRGKHVS